jgi:hypothetical protein
MNQHSEFRQKNGCLGGKLWYNPTYKVTINKTVKLKSTHGQIQQKDEVHR